MTDSAHCAAPHRVCKLQSAFLQGLGPLALRLRWGWAPSLASPGLSLAGVPQCANTLVEEIQGDSITLLGDVGLEGDTESGVPGGATFKNGGRTYVLPCNTVVSVMFGLKAILSPTGFIISGSAPY